MEACCPGCGCHSNVIHARYVRHLGDLPIAGRQAVVTFNVRRFRCVQPQCSRRTFVEQAPVLAARYAHRTVRLRSLLQTIGLTLGGRPGSRHCGSLAMPTSRITLLRLVRGLPDRPVLVPRVLGVDEFALRRGRRYGTILVDAQAHRVIDLLEDPSSDALVEWMVDHPGTRVICRDRDGVYASAARRGAPGAVQVADRWHLTHNLADALERYAVRSLASLRKDLTLLERRRSAATLRVPLPPPGSSSARLAVRTHRRHAEIHHLLEQGLTMSAIARQLKLDRKTVRRFMLADVPADLLRPDGPRVRALDAFQPHLARRWREGQHVAKLLFDEIRPLGYRGSVRSVARYVANWRTDEPPPPAHALLPGPRTLAWLLLRRPCELDGGEQRVLQQLGEHNPELLSTRRLVQQFLRMVRTRGGRNLEAWVGNVDRSGPPELKGFSRNLRRDWDAVQAGLTRTWSSGSVEGHVNKLKVIKRQMYGRARFDLLRKRVLLAP
jgi:transposase